MLEEMFKADSDNIPGSWQTEAEEEEVIGPDSPLPPGFEEVQPRGYDHDFWDPLIAKHLGGSDAEQVIDGIDVPKLLHTLSTKVMRLTTLLHHPESNQPTGSLIQKILPHIITVSPMYTLIRWTHAHLNQFPQLPHSIGSIHMDSPQHVQPEYNASIIHMDNLPTPPTVYISPVLHM